jgi:Cu-Zn family superoxide dismutase
MEEGDMTKTSSSWKLLSACMLVAACGGSSNKAAQPSYAEQPSEGMSNEEHEQHMAASSPDSTPTPTTETPTASDSKTTEPGTPTQQSTESRASAPVTGEAVVTPNKAAPEGTGSTPPPAPDASTKTAEANIVMLGKDGTAVGTLSFEQTDKGVVMKGTFTGLKPGPHGFHIHEKGDCGGKDAKNAGKHFNPTGAKHGPPESGTRHAGDFGNIVADKEGNASFEMTTDSLTVSPGADSVLGKAVIIHGKKDDGKSQPAGNSGPPIACGVINAK